MKAPIATLALAALAACGGGNEPGAQFEDTTSVTSEAPVVPPAGTVVDSAAAVRGTTSDSMPGTGTAAQ